MALVEKESKNGESHRRFIVAVTGASGSIYALRFLRALARLVPGESHLIVSDAALRVYRGEMEGEKHSGRNEAAGPGESKVAQAPPSLPSAAELLEEALSQIPEEKRLHHFRLFAPDDIGAPAASGSARFDGMVVVPCSMKSLAAIAHGSSSNLLERAADVSLKERRRLLLVVRETPYSLIHLRNMTAVTEAGGIILPASPGFYNRPQSVEDLGDFMAGRILSLLGVEHDLFPDWRGDNRLEE